MTENVALIWPGYAEETPFQTFVRNTASWQHGSLHSKLANSVYDQVVLPLQNDCLDELNRQDGKFMHGNHVWWFCACRPPYVQHGSPLHSPFGVLNKLELVGTQHDGTKALSTDTASPTWQHLEQSSFWYDSGNGFVVPVSGPLSHVPSALKSWLVTADGITIIRLIYVHILANRINGNCFRLEMHTRVLMQDRFLGDTISSGNMSCVWHFSEYRLARIVKCTTSRRCYGDIRCWIAKW